MKIMKAGLVLGVSLFSGIVFADCPQVVNYSLHSQDNRNCSYTSNRAVRLNFNPPKPPTPQACPRFILTDPGYHFLRCSHNIQLAKCVCTIRHN